MKAQQAINLFRISGELPNSVLLAERKHVSSPIIQNTKPSCNKNDSTELFKNIPDIRPVFLENPFEEATKSEKVQGEDKEDTEGQEEDEEDTEGQEEDIEDTDGQVVRMPAKPENLESMPKNVFTFPPSHELQQPYQENDGKRVEDEHGSEKEFQAGNRSLDTLCSCSNCSSPHGCEILNPDTIFVCEKATEPDRSVELLKAGPNAFENGKLLGEFNMFGQGHSLNDIHRIRVKGVRVQPFTTTAAKKDAYEEEACLPPALPPTFVPNCEIRTDLEQKQQKICVAFSKEPPQWEGGCDKICMPCCCPAAVPPVCHETFKLRLNTCKRIEYRLPSFSECKKDPFFMMCPKECCYKSQRCPLTTMDHGWQPLIRTTIRQSWILGRRTNMDQYKYHPSFSTSAAVNASDQKKKGCRPKGALPCLRKEILIAHRKVTDRKACDKFCMPCCAPARDPPDCFHPYNKPKCPKIKAPRPSYAECAKDTLKSPKPCECLIPRPPLCERTRTDTPRGCGRPE